MRLRERARARGLRQNQKFFSLKNNVTFVKTLNTILIPILVYGYSKKTLPPPLENAPVPAPA